MLIRNGVRNNNKNNVTKMKFFLIIAFVFYSNILLSQKKNDTIDCVNVNINQLNQIFFEDPSCIQYTKIKAYYTCNRKQINDFEIMYLAAFKFNCNQAYQDLYEFYQRLNYLQSNNKDCVRNSLLLDKLDDDSQKLAIKSLVKSNINLFDLAAYYYYGVYLPKNREKAISLLKSTYNYNISDEEIIKELDDLQDMFIHCE